LQKWALSQKLQATFSRKANSEKRKAS